MSGPNRFQSALVSGLNAVSPMGFKYPQLFVFLNFGWPFNWEFDCSVAFHLFIMSKVIEYTSVQRSTQMNRAAINVSFEKNAERRRGSNFEPTSFFAIDMLLRPLGHKR